MRLPLYVCVTCTQTFTRMSSARRHNFNLHFNRFRRLIFIRNQKMDDIESGFGATVHEASHRLSNKITRNESYDEFSRVSNLAEVKRLLVQRSGQSASIDRHMHILALFTSIPEYRNELDKYLAWLRRFCRYYDALMRLAK